MTNFSASKMVAALTMGVALAVPTLLPADAMAQSRHDRTSHRQQSKNQWRNLGIAGGALGVAGLLTGNKTLAALGIGGGAYSAYRYEQDRKSQNRDEHNRYQLFSNRSFDYGGHHYERRTRTRNGQKSYYFHRVR